MAEDPLRALLRGCRRVKVLPTRQSSLAVASVVKSSALPAELDFFNSTSTHTTPTTILKDSSQDDSETQRSGFASLLPTVLVTALSKMDLHTPTPIQRRAIPLFSADQSVIGIAPTGSGKTLAYALPLLQKLLDHSSHHCARALIVAPTRELAQQIGRVIHRVIAEGELSVSLKVVISKSEMDGLKSEGVKTDLLVSTPMRVVGLLGKRVEMGYVKNIVLDEADELFDEKFLGQIDEVIHGVGGRVDMKVHMFSASLSGRVEEMCRGVLKDSRKVVVGGGSWGGGMAVDGLSERVKQEFMFVGGRGEQGKVMAVRGLFRGGLKMPVLVFVQNKERAAELFRELVYDGVNVEALHGGRSVKAREVAVRRFREGGVWVLIATDVLARGVDFLGVEVVINYDVPSSGEMYLHRVGRTGRNGRNGRAITLWTEQDKVALSEVLRVAKAGGVEVPEFLGGARKDEVRRLVKKPVKRGKVGGGNLAELGRKRKRGKSRKHRQEHDDGPEEEEVEELVQETERKSDVAQEERPKTKKLRKTSAVDVENVGDTGDSKEAEVHKKPKSKKNQNSRQKRTRQGV